MSPGEGPAPAPPAPFRVALLDEAGSTNDLAREAALRGEPGGAWWVARRQTAGRGRQGRDWASPPGNFHGSLLLRTRHGLEAAACLSLVAGLAVAGAVHALSGGRLAPRLKWPNDVLLGGAKLAGILLEGGEGTGAAAGASWVVVGIGANLARSPDPGGLPYPATSLAAAGLPGVAPEAFLAALEGPLAGRLARFEAEGFAPFRRPWLDASLGLGAPVRLRLGGGQGGERSGRFADLGPDGALLLEGPDGRLERFRAGELFLAGASDPISFRASHAARPPARS